MSYPASIIQLYKCMMECQKKGTFTEHNLLDFVPLFWYNGDYSENYGIGYISKSSRGA